MVRAQVAQRIHCCGGDLSEWLTTHPRSLSSQETQILSELLSPARREQLIEDWQAPTQGPSTLTDDWDYLEASFRLISDFIHDGVTFRQPLSDALDLLAEEAVEHHVDTALELREFLFIEKRLNGNHQRENDPRNSDLAWAIAHGKSNPVGCCAIYLLLAVRLDIEIELVDFPHHMLCRIIEDSTPFILDAYDYGALHLQSALRDDAELSAAHRKTLQSSVSSDILLLRLLETLAADLNEANRPEDEAVILSLIQSIQ